MVRFARADGSKGSNKRVLEDATPWSEMVAQLASSPGKINSEGGQVNEKKRKKRKVTGTCVAGDADNKEDEKQHSEPVATVKGTGKKRKNKKDKEKETFPPKLDFIIDTEGERVKEFKDGTKRTWFDLPYEENERMTRYDNMWVKQEAVEELNQLKEHLTELNLNKVEVRFYFICST